MRKGTSAQSEDVIKKLKSLIVEVNYVETVQASKSKVDKPTILEKAKKVGKHLSDDPLSAPTPTRP